MWNPSAWFLMEELTQLPSTPMRWRGSSWNTRNTQTVFTLLWPWDHAPSTPLSSTLVYQVSVHCCCMTLRQYPTYPIAFNSRLPGECNTAAVWPSDDTPSFPLPSTLVYQVSVKLLLFFDWINSLILWLLLYFWFVTNVSRAFIFVCSVVLGTVIYITNKIKKSHYLLERILIHAELLFSVCAHP